MVTVQGGGSLTSDANNRAIQVAGSIFMEDATTPTPNTFPFSTGGAGAIELKIPRIAVETKDGLVLHLKAKDADLKVGKEAVMDGTAGEGNFLLEDGERQAFPCSDGVSIFIARDAGVDVTVHGYFEVV